MMKNGIEVECRSVNAECRMQNEEREFMLKLKSNILFHSAFIILPFAFLSLSGCEILGVAAHGIVGEAPIAAQYELPAVPTLVLVENYRSPDEMQLDGDQIAHEITDELKKEAKLDVVDPDKLVPLREDDGTKFRAMNIQQVGKAVGAKQVIYVDLRESEVTQDASAGAVHGIATASVKVIDTETGNTLWPTTAAHGKEVTQTMQFNQMDPSHAMAMHTDMLAKLSNKVARLFHNWKPDDANDDGT
jgi:TolB-like protein